MSDQQDVDQVDEVDPSSLGPNMWLVDEIYRQYRDDPDSVLKTYPKLGICKDPIFRLDTSFVNFETPEREADFGSKANVVVLKLHSWTRSF